MTWSYPLTLSWRRTYHIETRPLICKANQWTGFYVTETSVMKVLKSFKSLFTTLWELDIVDDCTFYENINERLKHFYLVYRRISKFIISSSPTLRQKDVIFKVLNNKVKKEEIIKHNYSTEKKEYFIDSTIMEVVKRG